MRFTRAILIFLLFMLALTVCFAETQSNSGVFRDDFDKLDSNVWVVTGQGVVADNGILQIKTSGGPGKSISITSIDKFLYGSAEIRVRFSMLGKGANYYLGFMLSLIHI